MTARIEFVVSILEDGATGEGLSFEITDEHADTKQRYPDGRAIVTKTLKKGESYSFSFTTDSYDRQWSVSPNVTVTIIEEVAHV